MIATLSRHALDRYRERVDALEHLTDAQARAHLERLLENGSHVRELPEWVREGPSWRGEFAGAVMLGDEICFPLIGEVLADCCTAADASRAAAERRREERRAERKKRREARKLRDLPARGQRFGSAPPLREAP